MERYIWLYGKHIPVTQEAYEAYCRPRWREEKQNVVRLWRETSLENMPEDLENLLQPSAEEMFFKEHLAEELHHALNMLTADEYNLIMLIFFGGYSEREVAKKINLSQKAVNKRKHCILKKIRKIISK